MAHTFTNLLTHIVFSTKERRPTITENIKPRLLAYMGGIVRELKSTPIIINGVADHVHLLIALSPTVAVSEMLRVTKANSSRFAHETWPDQSAFGWQTGYGAFSVSRSNRDNVVQYIENQEQHHRKISFKDEYLALLRKHEIEFDERFVLD